MKRSLTIAGILALAPLSSAFGIKNLGISAEAGVKSVTLGDRGNSARATLFAQSKVSSGSTATASTTGIDYTTPVAIVGASAMFPFGKSGNYGVKFVAEVHAANSDLVYIYNGAPSTATISFSGYGPSTDTGDSGAYTAGNAATDANFGVVSVSGGTRDCQVSHRAAYGAKLLYSFGGNHQGGAIGFGLLTTKDQYTYQVQENPTEGADVGVFSTTIANNLQLESMLASSGAVKGTLTSGLAYTPTTGVKAVYDDSVVWYGAVAEIGADLSKNICLKGGLGYYTREFDASKGADISAPMFTEKTDAYMYIGHLGFTIKRAEHLESQEVAYVPYHAPSDDKAPKKSFLGRIFG